VQRGARGFVIQLKAPNRERFALKYFKVKYRVPELAEVGKMLRQYAGLPGLRAANRIVFTLQSHPQLVRKYPPLEYGTLMPWLPGVTWFDVIVRRVPLTPRESLQLALNAIPAHIDGAAIETYLRQCRGVADIHDLHIWGMSTTESALTVHLVMPEGYPGDAFMDDIIGTLRDEFSIQHSTLQVEQGTTDHSCVLHPADTASTHVH